MRIHLSALEKWLPAFWLLSNCKNGISSYELARDLGVTQKSAWFMLHRIRTVMIETGDVKLGHNAPVEIDETFVGGKVKNIHKSKRKRAAAYQGGGNKAIVLGMLERGGKVRAGVIESRHRNEIQPAVHANVEAGSHIITDEFSTYPFVAKPPTTTRSSTTLKAMFVNTSTRTGSRIFGLFSSVV